MKKNGYFRLLALAVAAAVTSHGTAGGATREPGLRLLPIPKHLVMNTGRLAIDGSFHVVIKRNRTPHLERSVARFLQRLQARTGIPLKESAGDGARATLEIHCRGKGEQVQSVRADESYVLEITDTRARLSAPSPIGVLRGLETFLQLIDIDARSFFVPSLKIEDSPRFRWRGLLVDVSRHWEPVEMIKRNLDAMAAVKMNVFHWHLSDDQAFRVESKIFPKLHREGSDGKYYRQNEVREIVAYARDRGIRVVPEFDMPGHSTSWLAAYPELAAAPGPYRIERQWGVFDPCLDPSREEVYAFLDTFIGEMAALFPDEYFHIGGDEVNGKLWSANSDIRDFMLRNNLENNRDLQVYFNQRLLGILAGHGKKMIGWDEILHPKLPKSIIVQSWRGQKSLAEGARRGYSGILSFGYYLDHMQPASFHYAIDPLGNEAAELSDDEKTRILGGEACMWAEFVNPDNIESRIWPRTAAIAERLWSQPDATDILDLYHRLEFMNREFGLLGLRHQALYSANLQRMAGNGSLRPLKIFADLLKPPGLGTRQRAQIYFSHTPLNRLVDVLLPESKVAREFDSLIDRLLTHPDDEEAYLKVRKSLNSWLDNDADLRAVIERSYLLKETGSLAATVAELCKRSLEALDYLESHRQPTPAWQEKTAALLKRAEKPHPEIRIAVLPSIEKLIEEAGSIRDGVAAGRY